MGVGDLVDFETNIMKMEKSSHAEITQNVFQLLKGPQHSGNSNKGYVLFLGFWTHLEPHPPTFTSVQFITVYILTFLLLCFYVTAQVTTRFLH